MAFNGLGVEHRYARAGVENDALAIGMRVRPRIERLGEGRAALFFEPAQGR